MEYELNKYYVPADEKFLMEIYGLNNLYEFDNFVTNGVITVSKKYFPEMIFAEKPLSITKSGYYETFLKNILSDEKCIEIIEKYNELEKVDIQYKDHTLYRSRKRQDILLNSKYNDLMSMGTPLYDTKTQMIYLFWEEYEDEHAELKASYDLMAIILPFDKKIQGVKQKVNIIKRLEAYLNEDV